MNLSDLNQRRSGGVHLYELNFNLIDNPVLPAGKKQETDNDDHDYPAARYAARRP